MCACLAAVRSTFLVAHWRCVCVCVNKEREWWKGGLNEKVVCFQGECEREREREKEV